MKFSTTFLLVVSVGSAAAFTPTFSNARPAIKLFGKLDDFTEELNRVVPQTDVVAESKEMTDLDKKDVDRYGPGKFDTFVEFDEFDGGDGQTGCVGDGKPALAKFGDDSDELMVNAQESKVRSTSKERSAKVAWGTNMGYADKLRDDGVETSRAQQLENWANQQEVRKKRVRARELTESSDQVSDHEEDWRQLVKFGVERNEDFDLDAAFGAVTAGDDIEGEIVLKSQLNRVSTFEIPLKNPYMGFSDFRAAFTSATSAEWTITPQEGAISKKEETLFIVKFKPQNPGSTDGHLVIETEDFKKTWRILGTTG